MRSFINNSSQERKKTEIRANAVLLSIGEGVLFIDKEGKILFANKAFEELTGWKMNEVVGKFAVEVIPHEDEAGNPIPFEDIILTQVLAGKKIVISTTTTTLPTLYYVRKNKTRFPVSSIITPVIIKSNIIGAVEVFKDITPEKEFEKLQLDFLSLASHQLRTPLSGTKWLIETMNRGVIGTLNPRQKEYLDQIYKINERMIQLVFEILSVLRLESGTGSTKKESVFVHELFDHLLNMMEAAAKKHGVLLNNTFKDLENLAVETDTIMLKTILECFVSNAIDYSYAGQEVILGAENKPDAVLFFVRNFGPPIPKEEQKRIFERFYRSPEAKKMKPEGTGLGLYIAYMLAKKIRAEISFESEEGKGTTFYARVPKKMADRNNNLITKNS